MPKPILHTALFHLPHSLSIMLANSGGNLHLIGANHGSTQLINFYSKAIWLRLTWQSIGFWTKFAYLSPIFLLPFISMLVLFLVPKQTTLSYSSTSCFNNPILLPNTVEQKASNSYSIDMKPRFTINGYPVLSTTSCVSINDMPDENIQQTVDLKAAGFLNSKIEITTPKFPTIEFASDINQPVSPVEGINLKLDSMDKIFGYEISANGLLAVCLINDTTIECPIKDFGLAQGEKYQISINRKFKDSTTELLNETITLRDPLIFTGTSIKDGGILYNKPSEILLSTNKSISDVGMVKLTFDDTTVAINPEITKEGLKIEFTDELQRQKEFTLAIVDTVAEDGAYLPDTFMLKFSTSGGPQVISSSIGTYNVAPAHTIVLNFDSAISVDQNLNQFVTLTTANGAVEAYISAFENSISINPTNNLPACTSFSIDVKEGLTNYFGVSGGSSWSINSRTTCKQVLSIGTSVQGRALSAYRFGSGATKILFVGGMHGNERSSYKMLIAFVDELERKYSEIPSDKTIIIIPDINPDGYASNSRTNASGIDLNRNFPSNDWTTGVHMPGNIFLENGGGNSPLDQPESASLANYIEGLNPRLVLTYHAVARTVISNGAGDSSTLATTYSGYSGFAHYTHAHEDGIFEYPTTGEFETWLADKKGIPTLLVELATMSSNELYSQRSAMWAMLGI